MSQIRCAIYDRVSTDLQAREGLSLEAQKQALTEYAKAHGYEIAGYYADEGITARKKMQNRRDLIRLLNDVKADKIDLILVTKLDRWFRNIKDYHNTQSILEAHHCNWKTIFEEYDTSTSNGRFAINIMLSVNENECDRDSERIRSVFEYKKRQRQLLNGRPAYGYITDANKQLIKDPGTQAVVEDIFEHYFTSWSKKETVRYALSKYGDRAPTMYQINRILTSETYAGVLYGIPDYCEAYITRDQFRKIREVSDSKVIPRQSEPFFFSSLIRCPVCGRKMTGLVKRVKLKSGEIRGYKRYRCSAKFTEYHGGACLSETAVERYLLTNVIDRLSAEPMRAGDACSRTPQKNRAALIRQELERLNVMYQKARISEAYYDEQYALLSERMKSSISEEQPAPARASENAQNALAGGFGGMYAALDPSHKKAFWRSILKEISIDENSRKICGFKFLIHG